MRFKRQKCRCTFIFDHYDGKSDVLYGISFGCRGASRAVRGRCHGGLAEKPCLMRAVRAPGFLCPAAFFRGSARSGRFRFCGGERRRGRSGSPAKTGKCGGPVFSCRQSGKTSSFLPLKYAPKCCIIVAEQDQRKDLDTP